MAVSVGVSGLITVTDMVLVTWQLASEDVATIVYVRLLTCPGAHVGVICEEMELLLIRKVDGDHEYVYCPGKAVVLKFRVTMVLTPEHNVDDCGLTVKS